MPFWYVRSVVVVLLRRFFGFDQAMVFCPGISGAPVAFRREPEVLRAFFRPCRGAAGEEATPGAAEEGLGRGATRGGG